MDKLKKFKAYRNNAINDMNSLHILAQKARTDRTQHISFKVRYVDIQTFYDEFIKHHNSIVSTLLNDPESDVEPETLIRESFLADYYAVKTCYAELFEDYVSSPSGPSHNSTMLVPTSNHGNVRLPKIQLMKFSGEYRDFASFLDQFDALVHNNPSLTPIEKFTYLVNSVQGSALSLVKTLPLISSNYAIAYNSIIERFSNRRLQSQSLWTEIDNAPMVTVASAESLRKLLDVFTENVAALKNLKFPTEHWDFILVMMIIKRLDKNTLTRFEMEHQSTKVPTFIEIADFINRHCLVLETLGSSSSQIFNNAQKTVRSSTPSLRPASSRTTALLVNKSPASTCIFCQSNHSLYTCSAFAATSVSDRYLFCKTKKLCFNCLSSAHDLRSCKSTYTCKVCKSRFHHTLLHDDRKIRSLNTASPSSSATTLLSNAQASRQPRNLSNNDNTNSTFVGAGVVAPPHHVLLSTAYVDVRDKGGLYKPLRCLVDSGSMNCFITEKAVKRLNLHKVAHSVEVRGLGSMNSTLNSGSVSLSLKPTNADKPILFTDAIVIEKICENLPLHPVCTDSWNHIRHLPLADPSFHRPGPIDMLLGADIFSRIILNDCVPSQNNLPCAMNTVLGYIFMGKTNITFPHPTSSLFVSLLETSLDSHIQTFWEVEAVPEVECINLEESSSEKHFLETVTRANDGKFVVSLPFINNSTPQFPNMRDFAISRFYSLESRLLKKPQLYSQYTEFMMDYLKSGHMEIIPPDELFSNSYYLVHHCVLKPESVSTKLRVVFNASARMNSHKTLNEFLMTGTKLQPDFSRIIMNFRLFPFVICCDIRQMYRMIWLEPSQCDFQRILFRFSPNDEVQDFRLKTVTYGLRPSPYLALRVLRKLAEDETLNHPHAAEIILNNSYIDDFIFSAPTIDRARLLRNDLISLLEKAGFMLRKFCSNEPSLLNDLPPSHLSVDPLTFDNETQPFSLKVLGLNWNPTGDYFSFICKPMASSLCTKRVMLSELARVYDPLGFVTPTIFLAKNLIQQLWISKISWDETPPQDIIRVWNQYKAELPLLADLKIPRLIIPTENSSYEIHGFCDASEKGYACVIYLRTLNDFSISTHFLFAKSKLAPLKKITIPRLELCAAVLLSKLMKFTIKILEPTVNIRKVVCWSDSQIVLHWLKGEAHRWKPFVSNRVSFVQKSLPQNSWYYINTDNNPADIASRGVLPSHLLSGTWWFTGPPLLREREISSFIPTSSFSYPVEEQRKLVLLTLSEEDNLLNNLIHKFSSFNTLLRVTTYILRFINNMKHRDSKTLDGLSSEEMYSALLLLVKYTQHKYFAQEYENKKFSFPLRKLYAFLDSEGVLRVGGRIKHAHLPHDAKFPMLLPRQGRLTSLIIDHYHRKYLHSGCRTTQYLISQRFWILSSKRAINSVISKCIRCWKTAPKHYQPPMASLPESRINQAKAFLNSAVDFGGPYYVTLTRHRGVKSCKAYLCVFVCLATKAVHLELASDLSSETFLAALQRFVARRGKVCNIFCDNATNFVGANKQLNLMQKAAQYESIRFTFSPPSGPHFNGLAEAGIKSVKLHLSKVIGDQILSYEEFNTVLTLIESTLNSRPLTPFSSDHESVNILTPGHFLMMEPPSAVPTPDFSAVPLNRLSRWQLLQRIHHDFWRRWRREYLHTLQQRTKWLNPISPPKLDTMVLIKDDNSPPGQWNLGKIVDLHPGDDQIVRVATIKTSSGLLKRPLVKLCPLPSGLLE